MTTYDDALGVEGHVDDVQASSLGERRSPTSRVRVSWASRQPYTAPSPVVPTQTGQRPPVFDPVARAEGRRQQWARPLAIRAMVGDLTIGTVICTVVTATLLDASLSSLLASTLLGVTAGVTWCLALWLLRAYDSRRIGQGPEEFGMVGRAAVGALVALGLTSYLLQLLLPRRYVLIAVPLGALLTAVHRYLLRRWLHRQRDCGEALMRTLVVGSPSAVDDVVRDLSAVAYHGYEVIGACVPADMTDVGVNDDVEVVGTLSDVPQAVIDREADIVIVAGSGLSNSSLRRLSWALERTGADLVVAPGLIEVAGPRVQVRPAAGLSLLHVETPERHQGRMIGKALLDRSMGLMLFLAAMPLVGFGALLVKFTSRGPAFFRQERMGRDGQPFTMWKLRSMVVDAERQRTASLLDQTDRDGLMFKMHRDPRITSVGAYLRRFSLDELPQLWNVVRGEMSLVGPRPPLRSEYDAYHDAVHRRLRVKPGVTGLWQVSGRADLTWEESVRLDLRYVDNWSVALDLQILWKTARAVVMGSGAY